MKDDQKNAFGTLKSLNPYLLKYKNKLSLGILFILLTNSFNVLGPIYISKAIDSLKNGFSYDTLVLYSFVVILFAVGRGVFLFFVRQTVIVLSREIEFDIRNDLYKHLQSLSLKYFRKMSTGDIIARNTNDINAVRNYLGPGIMYSSNTIMAFVFIIPIMFYINWKLACVALIPLPLMSYLVFKMGKKIHETYTDIQGQYSNLTTRVQENLSGIRIVKSYGRELFEVDEFNKLNQKYYEKNLTLTKYQAFFYSGMTFFIGLSVILVVWFGGIQVMNGSLSLGHLAQFIIYVGMLIWPMIALGWVINILQQASASQKRIMQIMNTKADITDSDLTNHKISEIKGYIEFRNVRFQYTSDRPVLDNISFLVQPGQILAITGHTGSGKSTIVNLIGRLYDADAGEILIDGLSVKNIPLTVLRSSIGYVPQETFLFSDTIRNNIGFGIESFEDDHLLDAVSIAQIKENIEEFPNKYETFVGERGITLSGGQKQRTSIARALMRKPRILILDDCLSAVDTHTEDQILSQLKKVMRERTSIIISHRISTIKDADKIIVLKDGNISEFGSHAELVQNDGYYKTLYQKQLLEEELKALS